MGDQVTLTKGEYMRLSEKAGKRVFVVSVVLWWAFGTAAGWSMGLDAATAVRVAVCPALSVSVVSACTAWGFAVLLWLIRQLESSDEEESPDDLG